MEDGAIPFPGLLHCSLDPYLIVLRAKPGGILNHFLNLWYDSTVNSTPVSWTIGEHSNRFANGLVQFYFAFFKVLHLVFTQDLKWEKKEIIIILCIYLFTPLHKTQWMWYPMRLKLTLAGLLVKLANHYNIRSALISEGLRFDMAQGRKNRAPNETRTHRCRFANLVI